LLDIRGGILGLVSIVFVDIFVIITAPLEGVRNIAILRIVLFSVSDIITYRFNTE